MEGNNLTMKASSLKEGQSGIIQEIDLPKETKLRMLELGLRKGMIITVIRRFGKDFMLKVIGPNPIAVSKEILDGISIVSSSV
jgi:Fe2+ transport system protein FeoA